MTLLEALEDLRKQMVLGTVKQDPYATESLSALFTEAGGSDIMDKAMNDFVAAYNDDIGAARDLHNLFAPDLVIEITGSPENGYDVALLDVRTMAHMEFIQRFEADNAKLSRAWVLALFDYRIKVAKGEVS